MADIRDAYGHFVDCQWPLADSFNAPPPYRWPKSLGPVLIWAWKAFRNRVIAQGSNGGRESLVEAARWLKMLLRSVRAGDEEVARYYPWLTKLGAEMCAARLSWTRRYWGACTDDDRAWARRIDPTCGPLEPPALAAMKRALGLRSGLYRVTHGDDGERLEVPELRMGWIAWPKSLDEPAVAAAAQRTVGHCRPVPGGA